VRRRGAAHTRGIIHEAMARVPGGWQFKHKSFCERGGGGSWGGDACACAPHGSVTGPPNLPAREKSRQHLTVENGCSRSAVHDSSVSSRATELLAPSASQQTAQTGIASAMPCRPSCPADSTPRGPVVEQAVSRRGDLPGTASSASAAHLPPDQGYLGRRLGLSWQHPSHSASVSPRDRRAVCRRDHLHDHATA